MASIRRLNVLRVRNLTEIHMQPSEQINILHGNNGSGKTSLLESIYMLGLGRSFRSPRLDPLIQHGEDNCVVFAELHGALTIGLSKSRRQGHTLKLLGEKQKSWIEAARHLPVQVLNSESFLLLEGSSKVRRRFLDWGVFHVEHDFVNSWRRAAKCIEQRNLLLKDRVPDRQQLSAWDHELSLLAVHIDESRRQYVTSFLPLFAEVLEKLIKIPELNITYSRGWDEGEDLLSTLERNFGRDMKYGATQQGPHRADLMVKIGRLNAEEVLSRGQQKLLVSALKIAQGHFLSRSMGVKGVYLVDDLPSELDPGNRRRVCQLLEELGCQVFLSCVDTAELENCWSDELLPAKFHVEHGKMQH